MLSSFAKTLIQRCANALGYKIERIRTIDNPVDVLALLSQVILAKQKTMFFVQVGANDGMTGDPLRNLIIRHRLPGILVEPQPAAFGRLVENYAGQTQLAFENAAIGPQNGNATMYTPAAHLERDVLASFDRNVVGKHLRNWDAIEEINVRVCTMESLLEKHQVERLDLLQIDTEGFDCDVLEMTDLNKVCPSVVAFEHIHVPMAKYVACLKRLSSHGYQFLTRDIDTICVRTNLLN